MSVKNDRDRLQTRVAVYLIGMRGQNILLGKRQNTGHMDGHWSLLAGHVREGESCSNAMIREAQEEGGLQLKHEDLKLIGVMHHHSPPFDYIHYAFAANLESCDPKNMELHKCEALQFHDTGNLPQPMAAYVREIIQRSILKQGLWICEYGWSNKQMQY